MLRETKKAFIFDMDGTLCDVSSILHYLVGDRTTAKFKKNFNKFHEEAIDCPPNPDVVDLLWTAKANGFQIIVVTARKEQWRPHTSFWLAMHNIPSDALFMRGNHDDRSDVLVKRDILRQIRKFWDVQHAVDDNPKVIRLWQDSGISTTKIGDWDGEHQ